MGRPYIFTHQFCILECSEYLTLLLFWLVMKCGGTAILDSIWVKSISWDHAIIGKIAK